MKFEILDLEQGTQEWLDARRGRATASNAKSIVTPTGKLSASAEGYLRQLAREHICDDPLAFAGNKATEWGHFHEGNARMAFTEKTGLTVKEVGFCQSLTHPVLGCSPDGLITIGDGNVIAGLEIKCPQVDTHVEYLLEGVLPKIYAPQVHWSMAITGLPVWYFISYFPALNPLIVKVERDEYTEKIEAAAIEFANKYATEAPKIWERILPNAKALALPPPTPQDNAQK